MNTIANKSPEEIVSAKPQAAWNDANLRNPHEVADKRQRVQNMFAAIAPSYDLNNRLHSLWQDQRWRKKAVKLAAPKLSDRVIDVACGTGDLTFAFSTALYDAFRDGKGDCDVTVPQKVVGIDFTFEMLPVSAKEE